MAIERQGGELAVVIAGWRDSGLMAMRPEPTLAGLVTQAPRQSSQWIPIDAVPRPLDARRFVLEPLHEEHAELDFEALMSCRQRLREELQWGDWPPDDFSLELNRDDLRSHYGEFVRGEAFAYTVLNPERTKCLGCVYLERCDEIEGAQLAFWVTDDNVDMESVLLTSILRWVHEAWGIERVLLPLRVENARGIALTEDCGYSVWSGIENGPLSSHLCFLSESDRRH